MDLGLGIVVSLKDMLSNNSGKIERSMESLDGMVARTSESMTRHLNRIEKGAMMAGAGVALLAAPVALLSATTETQKALGELASLGVQDLRSLEDAAESFTNQWAGTTKAQFITASYDVRSALANLSDEAVGTFTAMAALTAKATKATTDEMVGTFTTAYGIYKPIMSEMSDMAWSEAFAGAMAQTVASFKTNGKQMSDAIKNIGAIASSANIPLQEQLAILGQLQTTMPGSEAGTLYKAYIMKAAEAGEKLGLTMTDANGRLLGIVPMMEAIRRKFPDMTQAATQVEIKKAFGSDEAVKFLLQMSQGLEGLRDNIQSVKHAMDTGTVVTQKMARAMNQDIGASVETIRQQIANLTEILGRTLIPVVTPLLNLASGFMMGLQHVTKAVPGLTQVVLTLVSGLGMLLVVAGGVIASMGAIGIALPAIKAGIAGFSAAMASAGTVIAAYFWPVTAAVAGVIAAIWLLRTLWVKNIGAIGGFVKSAFGPIRLAFQGVQTLVRSLKDGTGQLSAGFAKQLKDAGVLGFVAGMFQVVYRVRRVFAGFSAALSESGRRINEILGPAIRSLGSAFGLLFKAGLSVVEIFGLVFNAADASVFHAFGHVLGTVLGVIAEVGAFLVKVIIYPLSLVVGLVAVVAHAFAWLGKAIVRGIATGLQFLFQYFLPLRLLVQAVRMVGRVVYGLWGILSGGTSIVGGLKAIASAVWDFLLTPFRWAGDVLVVTWQRIKTKLLTVGDLFSSLGRLIVQGFKGLPMVRSLLQIFDLAEALREKRKAFFEAGKSWLLALARGIWSAITAPYQVLKRGFSAMKRLLPWNQEQTSPKLQAPQPEGVTAVTNVPQNVHSSVLDGSITPTQVLPKTQPVQFTGTPLPQISPKPVERYQPIQKQPVQTVQQELNPLQVSIPGARLASQPKPSSMHAAPLAPVQIKSASKPLGETGKTIGTHFLTAIDTAANKLLRLWRFLSQPIRLQTEPLIQAWQLLRDGVSSGMRLVNSSKQWIASRVPQTVAATLALSPALAGQLPQVAQTLDIVRTQLETHKVVNTTEPKPLTLPDQVWRINPSVTQPFAAPIPSTQKENSSIRYDRAAPALARRIQPYLESFPKPLRIEAGTAVFRRVLVDSMVQTVQQSPEVAFFKRRIQTVLETAMEYTVPGIFQGTLLLAHRLVSKAPDTIVSSWMIDDPMIPEHQNRWTQKEETQESVPESMPRQALLQQARSRIEPPNNTDPEVGLQLRSDLFHLVQQIENLANRPIQITVKTELDGRVIAESVYRDLREQKIKNYETFS